MDKQTLRDMSYGLFLIGAVAPGGKPSGCTANTVFQVGSDPAILAVSINHANYTNELVKQSGRLSVSILSQDAPVSVIGTFGFQSGRETDKFAGVPHRLEDGLPVLTEGVCGWLAGKVVNTVELASHTLFLVEITAGERSGGGKVPPMTYAYYHEVKKGTKPTSAPTYVEEAPAPAPAGSRYVCGMCRYEYDGSQGDFDALPDSWVCPICGAPKALFEKQ